MIAALALVVTGCATTKPSTTSTIRELPSGRETGPRQGVIAVYEGKASWYGKEQNGHATASGERFNMNALTAAHRTLHMNSRVRVTNLRNGRSVIVRINDRGPYSRGRIIDVSLAAAKQLQMIEAGIVPVRLEVLAP
ncbi:MAG TPA: septal ring lytic transglycosylase RlpA family protein [Polyangia bacterium]|nr:septal ring lytic transglycosylase RlpA family protein [Polyangia bacterium]